MSSNAKKALIALAVIAVLLAFPITDPTGSAHALRTVGGWFANAGESLMTFVRALFKG